MLPHHCIERDFICDYCYVPDLKDMNETEGSEAQVFLHIKEMMLSFLTKTRCGYWVANRYLWNKHTQVDNTFVT